mgnify:CR=1 FL=1|jgi:hypothetical protein
MAAMVSSTIGAHMNAHATTCPRFLIKDASGARGEGLTAVPKALKLFGALGALGLELSLPWLSRVVGVKVLWSKGRLVHADCLSPLWA